MDECIEAQHLRMSYQFLRTGTSLD